MTQNPKVDQMDVVKAFNNELVSLYEMKPPISKAKMTAITKAAMRAIKYYKHVVQGVEKFVSKCKQEFKIPGLYVIDSIVRQSRHQFGPDKDVFASRFAKNLPQTFVNIFQCPQEDKARVVRVVNLWKKSKLFSNQLLSELLRIGQSFDADTDVPLDIDSINKLNSKRQKPQFKERKNDLTEQEIGTSGSTLGESDTSAGCSRMMYGGNTDLDFLQRASMIDTNVYHTNQVRFNEKLLEFDYGEEEEEATSNNKDTNQSNIALRSSIDFDAGGGVREDSTDQIASLLGDVEVMKQLQGLIAQASSNDQTSTSLHHSQGESNESNNSDYNVQQQLAFLQSQQFQNVLATATGQNFSMMADDDLDDNPEIVMEKRGTDPLEVIDLVQDDTSPLRESPCGSRSNIGGWNNNMNRRRLGNASNERQIKVKSKEEERERRRKALPPIRRKHLSVCSTTLWVGHLSKSVQKEDLTQAFGEFGEIRSIDMIQPRGCAFLCLSRRQDAMRALHRLRHLTLHGRTISLDWAPGKGLKGSEWQPNWDLKNGVCYIPWSKLNDDFDYKQMEKGSVLDPDSMPDWLREKLDGERKTTNNDQIVTDEYSSELNSTIDRDSSPVDMIIDQPSGNQGNSPSNMITTHLVADEIPTNQMIEQQTTDIVNSSQVSMLNPFGLSPQLLAPVNVMPAMSVPPPSILVPPPTHNTLQQQHAVFHSSNMDQIQQQPQNGQHLFLARDQNKGDEDFRIISDGVQSKERDRQERCNNKERRNRWQSNTSMDSNILRDRSTDRDISCSSINNNHHVDNNYREIINEENSSHVEGNGDNRINNNDHTGGYWHQTKRSPQTQQPLTAAPNGDRQQQINTFHQRFPPPNTHFNPRHFTERPPAFIPSSPNLSNQLPRTFRPNINPFHDSEVVKDDGYSQPGHRPSPWRPTFDHARPNNSFHRAARPPGPPMHNMFRTRTGRPSMFRPSTPGVRGRNMNVFNNRCRPPPPLMGQGFRNQLRENNMIENNIVPLVNDNGIVQQPEVILQQAGAE